jgi:hypothetical protein
MINKRVVVIPEFDLMIKFGNKGVFPVKGILRSIGENHKGKWFSLLICKPIKEIVNGTPMKGFHYIERAFYLDQVVEGKEKLETYFEALK